MDFLAWAFTYGCGLWAGWFIARTSKKGEASSVKGMR